MSAPSDEPREHVLARFAREEDGASMVFAAITLFALTAAITLVYQMGMLSAQRMQLQTAADAAAYSAAQVEANSLNAIGQLNDGMAYVNYLLLRYTVDAIVYGTLDQYQQASDLNPKAPGFVLMGEGEGPARVNWIKNILQGERALDRGRDWMYDLHYAGRLILATTPRLMRETAQQVAWENGARAIAISDDVDRTLRFRELDSAGGMVETIGSPAGADRFADSLYRRYSNRNVRQALKVGSGQQFENQKQGFPAAWYSKETGRFTDEYAQVRLCWNRQDWGHHHGNASPPGSKDHVSGSYSPFTNAPNGHWHISHEHFVDSDGDGIPDTTITHMFGHRKTGDEDPLTHEKALNADDHHGVEDCPTCKAKGGGDDKLTYGGKWTEIRRTSGTPSGRPAKSSVIAAPFKDSGDVNYSAVFPRPIRLHADALRAGVTVVAWVRGPALGSAPTSPTANDGGLFPPSPWGVLAIASAAVGYETDQGVLPYSQQTGQEVEFRNRINIVSGSEKVPVVTSGSGGDDQDRNLFFGKTNTDGVRFGARLVPIAWQNTWHPQSYSDPAGSGLGTLLDPSRSGTRWIDCESGKTVDATLKTDLNKALTALRDDMFSVPDKAGLETLWH